MKAHLPHLGISLFGTFSAFLVIGLALAFVIQLVGKIFGTPFIFVAFHVFMLPLFCGSLFFLIMNFIGTYFALTIGINSMLLGFRILFKQNYQFVAKQE